MALCIFCNDDYPPVSRIASPPVRSQQVSATHRYQLPTGIAHCITACTLSTALHMSGKVHTAADTASGTAYSRSATCVCVVDRQTGRHAGVVLFVYCYVCTLSCEQAGRNAGV